MGLRASMLLERLTLVVRCTVDGLTRARSRVEADQLSRDLWPLTSANPVIWVAQPSIAIRMVKPPMPPEPVSALARQDMLTAAATPAPQVSKVIPSAVKAAPGLQIARAMAKPAASSGKMSLGLRWTAAHVFVTAAFKDQSANRLGWLVRSLQVHRLAPILPASGAPMANASMQSVPCQQGTLEDMVPEQASVLSPHFPSRLK